jgi:hypothetical protein
MGAVTWPALAGWYTGEQPATGLFVSDHTESLSSGMRLFIVDDC